MILPDKYVPYNKSNIYYSDLILQTMNTMKKGKTIEVLWNKFQKDNQNISFNNFYNSVLLLAILNLIEIDEGGELNEIKKTGNI